MAYKDIAGLAGDMDFTTRICACATEQAEVFVNDQRPAYVELADAVISDVGTASWFYWVVSAQPGFGDAFTAGGSASITDGQILSAVQAMWPVVAAAHDMGAAE